MVGAWAECHLSPRFRRLGFLRISTIPPHPDPERRRQWSSNRGPMPPPPSAPSSGGSMDLSLHIGPPRTRRRSRGRRSIGSPLTASTSAPSSSSTEESPAATAVTDIPAAVGGPHAPYSPSRAALFADSPDDLPPIYGVGDAPFSPSYRFHIHMPYEPHPAAGLPEEPLLDGGSGAGGDSSHEPYSAPFAPFLTTPPPGHDDVASASYEPVFAPVEPNLGDGDRVSPLRGVAESEFRIRMLMELRRRLRSIRQFRSAVSSIHTTEQLVHSTPSCGDGREDPGKNGVGFAGVPSIEGLEEEKKGGGSGAADFECNICLEVAKKPVVTCCGHLFCWPCLYQWLHLYCSHRECPVCKGEVDEASITPIYGRGRSEAIPEEQEGDAGGSGLRMPPRPHGRRIESWRQRIPRPTTRRFRRGIAGSWTYLFGEQFWNRNRGAAAWAPDPQENVEGEDRRGFTRLRRRRSTRVGENPESEYSGVGSGEAAGDATQNGATTSSYNQDGISWDWLHLNSSDRLAAFTARLSRIFGRPAASSGNHSVGSSLSANPRNPDDPVARPPNNGSSQGVDQFSTSSTIAVIREGAEVAEAMAEPNSAGSSSSLGRRGRSSFSGSLDVDGCLLHARKRRRLGRRRAGDEGRNGLKG